MRVAGDRRDQGSEVLEPFALPPAYFAISRHRQMVMVCADGLVWVLAIVCLNLIRYRLGFDQAFTARLGVVVLEAVGLQAIVGLATPLYKATWRVGSLEEMLWLAPIMAGIGTVVGLINLTPAHHVVPATTIVGGTALALLGAAGLRVAWRLNWERQRRPFTLAERAIIFGAGEAGVNLIEVLLADPQSDYLPVALLDDDPAKRNLRLRFLKV
ncbi:MAG TPA: hypothetical protein VFV02_16805, partial [Acidimicrobiales bacterium]|nr:hypothetical protein [Acidimicrobiales bacterium]